MTYTSFTLFWISSSSSRSEATPRARTMVSMLPMVSSLPSRSMTTLSAVIFLMVAEVTDLTPCSASRWRRKNLGPGAISLAISGSISTMVTCLPRSARKSAVSQPTMPPPAMSTFSPVMALLVSTSWAATTLSALIPGISGMRGLPPVATTTAPGFTFSTTDAVSASPNITLTPALSSWRERYLRKGAISCFAGGMVAMRNWPPSSGSFS